MTNRKPYTAPWNYKKISFLIAIFSIVFFSFNQRAFAQTSLNLGTSPASEKLQLQPGETHQGEIVVWNLSEETTLYNIYVRGFRQIENQPGTAVMFTEEEEKRALYSAAPWVTVSKESINLIPNRNEKIFYEIKVPKDATDGEYTVIIALISEDLDEALTGTAAFTSLSSGTPILVRVGDEFVESAELLQFTTDKNFYETPTVRFQTRVNNLGDTHITPIGEIVLTNIFNQEVAKIAFNENGQSILRDNSADYETPWDYGSFLSKDNKLILGPIKANLILMYRSFQPGFAPLDATTSFWILPWKYIVLLLLIIITTVVILKLRKKKKNQPQQLPK
jgi:hypothetical protein